MDLYLVTPYDLNGMLANASFRFNSFAEAKEMFEHERVWNGAKLTFHPDVSPEDFQWMVMPGHGITIEDAPPIED